MRSPWNAIMPLMVGVATPIYSAVGQSRPMSSTFTSVSGPAAEPSLFYNFSLTSYQALSLSAKFEKGDDNKQKLNIAPFKLNPRCSGLHCEFTLNLVQAEEGITLGGGISWNSASPFRLRNRDVFEEEWRKVSSERGQCRGPGEPIPACRAAESDAQYKVYIDSVDRSLFDASARIFERLSRKSWGYTTGINLESFSSLAGTAVDADTNDLTDNKYAMRALDVSGGLTYTPSLGSTGTLTYHFQRRRATAEEGQQLESYHGGALALAFRVKSLNPDYAQSEDFRKSLFIPAIVMGGSIEVLHCTATATRCVDAVKDRVVFTPFVDVKVKPAAQFRLALPYTRSKTGSATSSELAPAFQLAFQLAGLK